MTSTSTALRFQPQRGNVRYPALVATVRVVNVFAPNVSVSRDLAHVLRGPSRLASVAHRGGHWRFLITPWPHHDRGRLLSGAFAEHDPRYHYYASSLS